MIMPNLVPVVLESSIKLSENFVICVCFCAKDKRKGGKRLKGKGGAKWIHVKGDVA